MRPTSTRLLHFALGLLGFAVRSLFSFFACVWLFVFMYFMSIAGLGLLMYAFSLEDLKAFLFLGITFACAAVIDIFEGADMFPMPLYMLSALTAFGIAFVWGRACRRRCSSATE